MKWPRFWTRQNRGRTRFSTMLATENPDRPATPGASRTCGTHRTDARPTFSPNQTPPVAARAVWDCEVAALSFLLSRGWDLEPIDVNRAALVPGPGHWTGLGGNR